MARQSSTTPLKKERPNNEQITALKDKYGKLLKINITEDDMLIILKEPGIKELEIATAASRKPGALPYDFNRSILATCTVYSDEGFLSDDKRVMSVFEHLDRFKVSKEAEVEEL